MLATLVWKKATYASTTSDPKSTKAELAANVQLETELRR